MLYKFSRYYSRAVKYPNTFMPCSYPLYASLVAFEIFDPNIDPNKDRSFRVIDSL